MRVRWLKAGFDPGADGGTHDDEGEDAEDLEEGDHQARLRRGHLYVAAALRCSVMAGEWAASFKPATCCGGGFTFVAVAVVGADVREGMSESAVEAGMRV